MPWILVWSWRSKDVRRSSTVRFGFDDDAASFSSSVGVSVEDDDEVEVRKSP